MLSGKSLDLLLAAAAATGKLKSFARKFIKWVNAKQSCKLLCLSSWKLPSLHKKWILYNMILVLLMSFFFSFLFVPGLTSFPSTSAVKDVSSNTRVACSDVGIPFLIPHTRTNIEDLSLPQPNLHRYEPCSLTSPSSCSAMWCRHMVLRLVRDNSNLFKKKKKKVEWC